jgi:hypothetical protein
MNKHKSRETKRGVIQSAWQQTKRGATRGKKTSYQYIHSKVNSKSTGNEFAVHITIQENLYNLINEIQN